MEVTHNRRIEQTEVMDDDKSVRIKHDNTQNIMEEIISNGKTQNVDINKYAQNAIKNEYYELVEARNAVEYMKSFVTNTKYIIDQNSAKPKNYDKWTEKEQYDHIMDNVKTYFPNIPDSLSFFVPAAFHRGDYGRNSTDKPLWLDMEKFQRGQKFARDHIFAIFFSNMISLFEMFAFADALQPLIFSQQSHTPYLAFKRYLSTSRRIQNWMMEDPWTVGTQAYKNVQVVRKMHRAIRLKLCKSDHEELDKAVKIENPWCPDREIILKDFSSCPCPTVEKNINMLIKLKGLNQADMAATQFAFMGMILLYSDKFGVNADDEDLAAFCHTWRGIGYLLGIEDRYNFCRGSLQEIKQRSRDFIDIWVKSYLRQITPEWEHMARCVTEGGTYYINIYSFKVLLLILTDLLNIDMPCLRNTLTYYEWFCLMFHRVLCRYARKFRFIRVIMNTIVHKAIDKAIKYGPEKHEKLKERSQQTLNRGQ